MLHRTLAPCCALLLFATMANEPTLQAWVRAVRGRLPSQPKFAVSA